MREKISTISFPVSARSLKLDKAAAEKIAYEIGQINKLLSDAGPLLRVCAAKEPDFIELSAAALLLHSFYNGIENILVIISKSRGSQEMNDAKWHRSLLEGAVRCLPAHCSPRTRTGRL